MGSWRQSSWRSSVGTRIQRGFHLLDKMLVAMASLVFRKERIWQIRELGRLLILSTCVSSSKDNELTILRLWFAGGRANELVYLYLRVNWMTVRDFTLWTSQWHWTWTDWTSEPTAVTLLCNNFKNRKCGMAHFQFSIEMDWSSFPITLKSLSSSFFFFNSPIFVPTCLLFFLSLGIFFFFFSLLVLIIN